MLSLRQHLLGKGLRIVKLASRFSSIPLFREFLVPIQVWSFSIISFCSFPNFRNLRDNLRHIYNFQHKFYLDTSITQELDANIWKKDIMLARFEFSVADCHLNFWQQQFSLFLLCLDKSLDKPWICDILLDLTGDKRLALPVMGDGDPLSGEGWASGSKLSSTSSSQLEY